MKVGLIGCGLMGKRRVSHLDPDDQLVAAFDLDKSRCPSNALVCDDVKQVCNLSDSVIVATTNESLVNVAVECLRAGKPVLLEKPCACDVPQAQSLYFASEAYRQHVVPGFTLRHYPGIIDVRNAIKGGVYGRPLNMRLVYGHGAREGYGSEWRCDPARGGGELLDQGVHLIDLALHLIGPIKSIAGARLPRSVWTTSVEDNVFALFDHPSGAVTQIHASWTEWRPTFRLEMTLQDGYIVIEGLGSSTYGTHRAAFRGRRETEKVIEYPNAFDAALRNEWKSFKRTAASDHWLSHEIQDVISTVEKLKTSSLQ